MRISRIRLTEGVSSVSTRNPYDLHEAPVNQDDGPDARKSCDRSEDKSHVDFDGSGACTSGFAPHGSPERMPGVGWSRITTSRRYYGPLRFPIGAPSGYGFPLSVERSLLRSDVAHPTGPLRFLTVLSMPAVPNHPARSRRCKRSLLHVTCWLHHLRKAGHLGLCVTRPNRVHAWLD